MHQLWLVTRRSLCTDACLGCEVLKEIAGGYSEVRFDQQELLDWLSQPRFGPGS